MKPMNLCTPALIYAIFSMIQIFFDLYSRLYIVSISKIFVTIIFTYLLNLLCSKGLTVISWFLIFIPFIFTLIFIEILLVSMGIHMLGSEVIEKINKIEQIPNHKQNQNQSRYIDISYSEAPHFNDTNDTNDTNDMINLFDLN